MTRIMTPAQVERARELLDGVLVGRDEISLLDATRNLAIADRHERALADKVRPALVSLLLRRIGFRKVGNVGIGYDRCPLYRKAA